MIFNIQFLDTRLGVGVGLLNARVASMALDYPTTKEAREAAFQAAPGNKAETVIIECPAVALSECWVPDSVMGWNSPIGPHPYP